MFKRSILTLGVVVLMTSPLMANKLVCPVLTWKNPIFKTNFKPTVESTENYGSPALKCNYKHSTPKGTYRFSIQKIINDNVLVAMANMQVNPMTKYTDMTKAYRKKALSAHPDKGGSTEAMQSLNNDWDLIKKHFNFKGFIRKK